MLLSRQRRRPTRPKQWTINIVWWCSIIHRDQDTILADYYRRYYRYRFPKEAGRIYADRKFSADRKFEWEACVWAMRTIGPLTLKLLLLGIKIVLKA